MGDAPTHWQAKIEATRERFRASPTEAGFGCPHCHQVCNGIIVDSRQRKDFIRRRRECEHCSQRFTTYEQIDTLLPQRLAALEQTVLYVVGILRDSVRQTDPRDAGAEKGE